MNTTIKFAKVNPNAIIPSKRDEDGWYDIYMCSEDDIIIPAHTVKLIPTGIASVLDTNYRMGIFERGSNTKSTLIVMAGRVDSGYRGEWFVALYNGNDIPIEISNNITEIEKTEDYIRVPSSKAIAQASLEEVPSANVEEITYEELLKIPSERGINILGSSGK